MLLFNKLKDKVFNFECERKIFKRAKRIGVKHIYIYENSLNRGLKIEVIYVTALKWLMEGN